METIPTKAASYKDILKNFQQAEDSCQTTRDKKIVYRPLYLKKAIPNKQNKQNTTNKHHIQSVHQKSVSHKSEWVEEDVLKQYNQKRKDKQLQLSYNKFITYITNILTSLTGSVPPQLLTNRLTYLQYLAALKEMAFIKDNYEPSPNDTVTELWNQLSSHSHSIGAFILFIASILNMRRSDDQNGQRYLYLSKKYSDLRFTRMQMLGKTKTIQDEQEFPFTPSISQRSRTLAASRSRSKGKADKCLAQKSYHQLLECSNDSQTQPTDLLDSLAGNRRSEILYKMAKQKSLEKKRDKKSSEVEYEKSIKQLTFHPKIHPNAQKQKQKKSIQGEQDSINRMIRGRIQRQVRRVIQEKGLPYNQKLFQRMKKQKYEAIQKAKQSQVVDFNEQRGILTERQASSEQNQRQIAMPTSQPKRKKTEPIVLTIEVDEDRCEKLIIQDPSKYKEVAAKFIKDFNLRPQMYDKLIDGVQKALKFQLTQVDQDSCESEYESVE